MAYEYRNVVGVTGGRHSAAVRDVTGLDGGDLIGVTMADADTPHEVTVPADFAAALDF